MTPRTLLVALALVIAPAVARAQANGIQIAPVLVSMSPARSISSLRIHNGRARPIAFEVEAYAWSQENGQDRLTPTNELLIAPGVFEIPTNGEQTLRLGVHAPNANSERAYRIVMRELPSEHQRGAALGFTLEMSLPVFVTPHGARSDIRTRIEGQRLILTNTGTSFSQINLIQDEGRIPAPRYLLAGAAAEIVLPARTSALRLLASGPGGQQSERAIDVGRPDQHASVR